MGARSTKWKSSLSTVDAIMYTGVMYWPRTFWIVIDLSNFFAFIMLFLSLGICNSTQCFHSSSSAAVWSAVFHASVDISKYVWLISIVFTSSFVINFSFHYSTGYIGPVCVVVFFAISTILNKFLMSPVVTLVFKQEKLEGDFRWVVSNSTTTL